MIKFQQTNHSYSSTDNIDWISVTSLIKAFHKPFDPMSQSVKCSKNKRSKWYGMLPEDIRKAWKNESKRSVSLGTWYHTKRENETLSSPNVVKPIYQGDDKIAPEQRLLNNHVYPEHFTYLLSAGVCGQSDKVEITDNKVNIRDYKTLKSIKMEGFTDWEGITEKMFEPISHLDNCDIVHHSLQMSVYMYMILKHNPEFSFGKLTLEHILFELQDEDEFGYPIYKKDDDGNFIIREIKLYNIPYLKDEVTSLLKFLKDNRQVIKSRIWTR